MHSKMLKFFVLGFLLIALCGNAFSRGEAHFEFNPAKVLLNVGDSTQITIKLFDDKGEVDKRRFFLIIRGENARRSVTFSQRTSDSTGVLTTTIQAHRPGSFKLYARSIGTPETRVQEFIPVEIAYPPLRSIQIVQSAPKLYVGTNADFTGKIIDEKGFVRDDLKISWTTDKPEIAKFDKFGVLFAQKPGEVKITASVEKITETFAVKVAKNPVETIEVGVSGEEARTGDVLHFRAIARNGAGKPVEDAKIHYTFLAKPDDDRGPKASGQIMPDGRFVAATPGVYTIIASSASHSARKTVRINPRNVEANVEVVGHGPVLDVLTSDLWVWEGVDGRDYAVTGTWGAKGDALFWDVTDPSNMVLIDTISVDARTVNDVKVSEDGRICVITREGASNRKNGVVILDVSNPRDVKILSRYDEGLTGGVHNVYIYDNHVYAVNNGRRFDVLNIEDPANPKRVSKYELDTPGHGIHDVWIEDGVAYTSNWQDGVHLIDVGGVTQGEPFRKLGAQAHDEIGGLEALGGSPSNPVGFASYEYPSGWNHAAFPFQSRSANKFYVVAGDEAFPYGDNTQEGAPTIAAGWLHFVDFTNIKAPQEVARYEIPLAGSHNYWIESDTLYAAFYNGGLRVVDISGELLGDLYQQGREIAWFLPSHTKASVPNASMVWGPQPYKGLVYFSDHHSGLWAVRIVPKQAAGDD